MREVRAVSKIKDGEMLSYQVLKFYEKQAKIYKKLYESQPHYFLEQMDVRIRGEKLHITEESPTHNGMPNMKQLSAHF